MGGRCSSANRRVSSDPDATITCDPSKVSKTVKEKSDVEPARPFPKLGVKLEEFEVFIARCGGEDALIDLTTNDICNDYLKPLTVDKKVSYCDLLLSQGRTTVGMSTVFISHAW